MNEHGQIDYETLKSLVDWHLECGTNAIVAMGTTAESCTLTQSEHISVVKTIAEQVAGKVPVIAGNGLNSTQQSIELTQALDQLPIDGFLTVTPYYNKPTQKGLQLHFEAIANSTVKPILLYNVPGRTACDLLPETVAALSHIDNIVGIKEATGDKSRVSQLQSLINTPFTLLSGDDETALEFTKLGGHGVISVTANVMPAEMAAIYQSALNGDFSQAEALNEKLERLHNALFIEPNPVPVKWALKKLNRIPSDQVRLPLLKMESSHQTIVIEAMESAQVI